MPSRMTSRLLKIAIRLGASLAACGLFAVSSAAVAAEEDKVAYCLHNRGAQGCDLVLSRWWRRQETIKQRHATEEMEEKQQQAEQLQELSKRSACHQETVDAEHGHLKPRTSAWAAATKDCS